VGGRLYPGRAGGPAGPPTPRPRADLAHDPESLLLGRIEAPPRPEDGSFELRGDDVRRTLERVFAARNTLAGVYMLLHRLDLNDLMPRPQHPDTHPVARAFFKEIVVEHIAAITEKPRDREVQVWHHDEVRFGRPATITRARARRGSRPRRWRQTDRASLYVLTEVCATSGAAVGLIMPELNTAVINLLPEKFARKLAPGVHAILLWDNAGYHVSDVQVVPPNVGLIGLLPYSPELDLVETLWHDLRSHHRSNRVYRDDALLEAAMEPWRAVGLDPETIRSVRAATHLNERRCFFRSG
jgi:hypothetical protein